MNYALEWERAHQERLMRAGSVDPRLVDFAIHRSRFPDILDQCWLEVGCGTGINLCWLAECGFIAMGFDSSPSAIMRAEAFASVNGAFHFPPLFRKSDVTGRFPYDDAIFDAAIDICCLENLDDAEFRHALSEIARVLQPKGRFFSLTASPGRDDALTTAGVVRKPDYYQLRDRLVIAGFDVDCLSIEVHLDGQGREVENWHIEARKR